MVVVGDLRTTDPVEDYAEWRHWCQRELCAHGFCAVVVVYEIPTFNYLDPKAGVVGFCRRHLQYDFGDVEVEGVIVVVEDAVAVDAALRPVQVVLISS